MQGPKVQTSAQKPQVLSETLHWFLSPFRQTRELYTRTLEEGDRGGHGPKTGRSAMEEEEIRPLPLNFTSRSVNRL